MNGLDLARVAIWAWMRANPTASFDEFGAAFDRIARLMAAHQNPEKPHDRRNPPRPAR